MSKNRELVLDRLLDAPVENIWRCWTEADLARQWFAPKPWSVSDVAIDPRAGGIFKLVMRSPEGQDMDGEPGVILEAVPNRRLVWTDAFTPGWAPKDGVPFMVAEIGFADEGGKTRYTARVRHWSDEACEQHKQMGFHEGWGQCADQLEALARTL